MRKHILILALLLLSFSSFSQTFYKTKANSGIGEYETDGLIVSSVNSKYVINYGGYNIFELSFVKKENGKYEYTSDEYNTLYVISTEKLSDIVDGKIKKATLDFILSDVWVEYVKIELNDSSVAVPKVSKLY